MIKLIYNQDKVSKLNTNECIEFLYSALDKVL